MDATFAALVLALIIVTSLTDITLAAICADKNKIAKRALDIISKISKKKK
jgi:hypothetical protein